MIGKSYTTVRKFLHIQISELFFKGIMQDKFQVKMRSGLLKR